MALQDSVRARWDRLNPKHKQWLAMGAGFAVLVGVLWPLIDTDKQAQRAPKAQNDLSTLVTSADPRKMGVNAVSAQVQQLQAEVEAIQRTLGRMDTREGEAPKSVEALRERVNELARERTTTTAVQPTPEPPPASVPAVAPSASGQAVQTPFGRSPAPGQLTGGQGQVEANQAPSAPPRILTAAAPQEKAKEVAAPAGTQAAESTKTPGSYIPSGSLIAGVLINGIDAPTGRSASGQPQPVLVRIKHEAILPNRFRADVRECFAILAGYGDLSSERAILRAESLSCVRADGKVIDTRLEMYAIGEDGKAGVRGRLVSKQGSAIAKAMVAGFAQSYAQALRPNYTGYYGGAGGGVALGADQMQAGAYGGASSALDRVAKFYIDMANQMFPVVEVDAGRPVTLVVLHGAELALAKP